MRAGDVLLFALLAGAGGVLGALWREYAAGRRVGAPSTACAVRPPGATLRGEHGPELVIPERHFTYVGGPNRRGPGRPAREAPLPPRPDSPPDAPPPPRGVR